MSTLVFARPNATDVRQPSRTQIVRRILTFVVMLIAVSLGTTTLITGPAAAAPAKTVAMVAKTTVNLRTGPSAKSAAIGKLRSGQRVDKLGTKGSWTKIKYKSKSAWVASSYLRAVKITQAPTVHATDTKITTTAVNLRRAPSATAAVDRVLPKGTKIGVTGRLSKGFSEVVYGGAARWINTQYLATILPKVIGYRTATADLIIRSTPDANYKNLGEIKKGSRVAITGTTKNGRAQIIHQGAVRWVTAQYLSDAPVTSPPPPSLPAVVGYRYATTELLLRSTAEDNFQTLGSVPGGTELAITATERNGRTQVVYQGAVRWVTSAFLSTTRPTIGGDAVERGLQPNAIKVYRAVRLAFPEVTTYYGVHPDPIPDHPSGLALDIMIPGDYRSAAGRAYGQRIAAWAQANQADLGIEYVIWDQHIWNIRRAAEGWRFMADRGTDSANHKNHVHITVFP